MLDSKLRKSMWKIHTTNGSIEEVLRDSSDFIALNFNKGINQEFCLQFTTTKEGYIAIQISSQTTKKKVSENP